MEKSEFEQLKEKIKINFLQIEKILARYDDRLKDAERELVKLSDISKKFEELDKKLEDLKKKANMDIEIIKKELEELKEVRELKDKLPDISKRLEEIHKNIEEWKTFAEEFNENKDMYLELREVVISSIEHLKEKEKIFDRNLEEFAIIAKKLEENERAYENMSSEINRQLSILNEESKKMREEIKNFKSELTHVGNIKIQELENKIEKFEKEVVPKKIDDEMNKIIKILNEKAMNFATLNKFEEFKNEIVSYIKTLREPKVKSLEEKMNEIERDLMEVKELIKNFSSRLPIVVE
jgi:chromosome segregation ATPase